MRLQLLHDSNGENSGVYIPSKDWTLIKQQYPDIEEITDEIPDWKKEILTARLAAIAKQPERIKPIEGLFDALDKN